METKDYASKWKEKAIEELKNNSELAEMGAEDSDVCSGSDSNPSDDDLPEQVLRKVLLEKINQRTVDGVINLYKEDYYRSVDTIQREIIKKKQSFDSNKKKNMRQAKNMHFSKNSMLQNSSKEQVFPKVRVEARSTIDRPKKPTSLIPMIARTMEREIERNKSIIRL